MFSRFLFVLMWCVATGMSGAVLATPALGIATDSASAVPRIVEISVRSGVPVATTLSAVQAMGDAAFQTFEPQAFYPTDQEHAMWLRLRMVVNHAVPSDMWVLDFPQQTLDSLHLYAVDAQGNVFTQRTGDQLAMDKWSVSGLYPRLMLPPMATGEHVIWLKVEHKVFTHLVWSMRTLAESNTHLQHYFLIAGLLVGVVGLMVLVSAYWAISTWDRVTAWYSLFALSSLATVAVYFGLGSYFFWPHVGLELEHSKLLMGLILLMIILQLQFCKLFFASACPPRALQHLITVTLWLSSIGLLAYCLVPMHELKRHIFIAAGMACITCMALVVGRALAQGQLSAKLWMLAYLPLAIVAITALGQNFGVWIPVVVMPTYMPMVLLVSEVPFLLLVLHLRHRNAHAQQVETTTLSKLDPLTGFLSTEQFSPELERMCAQSSLANKDMAVVYLKAMQAEGSTASQSVQAVVRILRTVTSPGDVVANVGDKVYAIILPNTSIGENLSTCLSRLVALGMMAAKNGLSAQGIQFRVVCGTLRLSSESSAELHAMLLAKLHRKDGWDKRSIRYVLRQANRPRPNVEQMSVIWDDALAKSTVKS